MGNHNIFIAECKYWSGAKGLGNTLDQLFRYVTWRDTKTSIIKFVDRKSFTPIVEEATKTVRRGDADREGAASAFQREYPADHVGHGSACREDRPRFESRQLPRHRITSFSSRGWRNFDNGGESRTSASI